MNKVKELQEPKVVVDESFISSDSPQKKLELEGKS